MFINISAFFFFPLVFAIPFRVPNEGRSSSTEPEDHVEATQLWGYTSSDEACAGQHPGMTSQRAVRGDLDNDAIFECSDGTTTSEIYYMICLIGYRVEFVQAATHFSDNDHKAVCSPIPRAGNPNCAGHTDGGGQRCQARSPSGSQTSHSAPTKQTLLEGTSQLTITAGLLACMNVQVSKADVAIEAWTTSASTGKGHNAAITSYMSWAEVKPTLTRSQKLRHTSYFVLGQVAAGSVYRLCASAMPGIGNIRLHAASSTRL